MIPLLLAALLGPASAQDGLDDVQSVDERPFDTYRFKLPTCDGVRAEVRAAFPDPSPQVVVELTNEAETACTYANVAFKGWVMGAYVTNRAIRPGEPIRVEPGTSVAFRIKPGDAAAARGGVQLQIAPGKGTILLIGLDPAPPPAAAP